MEFYRSTIQEVKASLEEKIIRKQHVIKMHQENIDDPNRPEQYKTHDREAKQWDEQRLAAYQFCLSKL